MNADEKRCPYCDEVIKKSAKKCRFCGEWLEAPIESISVQHKSESTVRQTENEEPVRKEPVVKSVAKVKERVLKVSNEPKETINFIEAVTICLKKYFKFSGRARVGEYWWFFLLCHGALIIPIVLYFVGLYEMEETWHLYRDWELYRNWESVVIASSVSAIIWIIITIVPLLSVTVRRLHDSSTNGWYALLGLIVPMGNIVLMWNLAQKGTAGDNKYGSDPVLRE